MLVVGGAILVGGAVLWNWPSGFAAALTTIERVMTGVRLERVQVDGRTVPFLSGGSPSDPLALERVPVLVLHGWNATKDDMIPHFRCLLPSRRVVAPDLPGFGENPFPPDAKPLDADGYIQWIEAFRVATNLGIVDVHGHSMSGAFAAAYAAAYPNSVRKLVMESAAGLMPPKINPFMQLVLDGADPLNMESDAAFEQDLKLGFVKSPTVPRPYQRFLIGQAVERRVMLAAMLDSLRPFLLDGNASRISAIRAPTLILYGAEDHITDPSLLQPYLRGIRGAEGLILSGAGHEIFWDNPDAAKQALLDFLDR